MTGCSDSSELHNENPNHLINYLDSLKEEANTAVVVSAMSGVTHSPLACLEGKSENDQFANFLLESQSTAAKAATCDYASITHHTMFDDI